MILLIERDEQLFLRVSAVQVVFSIQLEEVLPCFCIVEHDGGKLLNGRKDEHVLGPYATTDEIRP